MGLGKVTAAAGHALSRYSYGLYVDYSSVNALAQAQQQRLALLGNIRHPGVGGCRPQQRHIQQRRHRSGRIAVAVRQLVDKVRRRIVIP